MVGMQEDMERFSYECLFQCVWCSSEGVGLETRRVSSRPLLGMEAG